MRNQFAGASPQDLEPQNLQGRYRLANSLVDLNLQSLLVATANGLQNARAVGIQESSALRGPLGVCPFQGLSPLRECPYDAKLPVPLHLLTRSAFVN